MVTGELDTLRKIISERAFDVYERADAFSRSRAEACADVIDTYLAQNGLPADQVCFIAVGSVGRREALAASDLDLIPVLRSPCDAFDEHDSKVRKAVEDALGVKVSRGADLTRRVTLGDLTHQECIGGDRDDSPSLTKRVLILSESVQVGGQLDLRSVRREVLDAYGLYQRTSGRHFLTLCNDIARYYRTLCIEYKAKIDNEDKDWCTRNLKLRHSRKFWYFATMLALASLSRETAEGRDDSYRESMLNVLSMPPYLRFVNALPEHGRYAARPALESFAWFLGFMAVERNRAALASVEHEDRYSFSLENPFPAMKFNSDLLHREMIALLDTLDRSVRTRILDWFLL